MSDEANIEDSASAEEFTILLEEAERPEIALLDSIGQDAFASVFWQDEVLHVIPMADSVEEVKTSITMAQRSRAANMPNIVVDAPLRQSRDGNPIYSMKDREEAQQYLLDNLSTLKIQAVGLTKDKIAVYMEQGTTEADQQAVMEASPVKAIEFMGVLHNDEMESEDIAVPQTRATATSMRGGNGVGRTNNGSLWSTIAVSAVRNYNASTGSGEIGFLTCGHGYTNGSTVYHTDGTTLGTVDVRYGKDIDVAFVKLNNTALNSKGWMNDNTVRVTRRASITSYDQGKDIKKYGARNRSGGTAGLPNKNETGKISIVKISGTWGGYSYTNLFETTCSTVAGDSGGPFVINNDTIVGIMKGARGSSRQLGKVGSDIVYDDSVVYRMSDIVSNTNFLPAS